MKKIRQILWRILGFDYQTMLWKTDYVLLRNDRYTQKGKHSYDNGAKVWRWSDAALIIGKYCSIAHGANFIVDEGHHAISDVTNFPLADNLFKKENSIFGMVKKDFFKQFKQKEGITIGNDVWIGMGVTILPGLSIGNGVTIAAGAVVTKDIEDYCLVAGSPAKVVKSKCTSEQAIKMIEIAWWNWEEYLIKERIGDFNSLSIPEFIEKYAKDISV